MFIMCIQCLSRSVLNIFTHAMFIYYNLYTCLKRLILNNTCSEIMFIF